MSYGHVQLFLQALLQELLSSLFIVLMSFELAQLCQCLFFQRLPAMPLRKRWTCS